MGQRSLGGDLVEVALDLVIELLENLIDEHDVVEGGVQALGHEGMGVECRRALDPIPSLSRPLERLRNFLSALETEPFAMDLISHEQSPFWAKGQIDQELLVRFVRLFRHSLPGNVHGDRIAELRLANHANSWYIHCMRNYEVPFTKHEPVKSLIELENKFQFRQERGWKLLQCLCLWVLRKLGCYAIECNLTYKTHTIRPDDFVRNLIDQKREIVELYHLKGDRLLIGPEEYFDILKQDHELEQLGMFPSTSFVGSCNYGKQILGMKVTVIPWMKGMLVVPKDMS